MNETIPLRSFSKKPSFAELWDTAVDCLYNPSTYTQEFVSFLKEHQITQDSKIADVAAGAGFPALLMREQGFNVDCFDIAQDQVILFKENAKKQKVDSSITRCSWLDLPQYVGSKKYDFIMCRGNSFIYAPGGWNSDAYNVQEPIKAYKDALKVFYDLLSPGGMFLVDKFKDSEQDHKVKIGNINIEGETYGLIFYTKLNREKRNRFAQMLLQDKEGHEEGVPNFTYALSEAELMQLAQSVGFSDLEKICLDNEKHFDVFTMRR